MKLLKVRRNDLDAAERYYKMHGSRVSTDEYRVLYKLQDDPAKFVKLSKDWNVVKPKMF